MGVMTVSKGVLKAKMLEYFRRVEETGDELIVTSHRKPVLLVTPLHAKKRVDQVFGKDRGQVEYISDILEPETEEWSEI